MSPTMPSGAEVLERLRSVLDRFAEDPAVKHLRVRIRELGANELDEVEQLQELRRACRDSASLDAAFVEAGLGSLKNCDLRKVEPAIGALVQAFNRFVEEHWEPR